MACEPPHGLGRSVPGGPGTRITIQVTGRRISQPQYSFLHML